MRYTHNSYNQKMRHKWEKFPLFPHWIAGGEDFVCVCVCVCVRERERERERERDLFQIEGSILYFGWPWGLKKGSGMLVWVWAQQEPIHIGPHHWSICSYSGSKHVGWRQALLSFVTLKAIETFGALEPSKREKNWFTFYAYMLFLFSFFILII